MIRGVLAILKSGLLIAQKGFEKAENILPPLMSAVLNLSEALGAGNVESLELKDLKVYIVASNVNPDVVVAIVAQKPGDSLIEILARDLITKIDRIISKDMDVVTSEVVNEVEKVLEEFMKGEAKLPSFKQIVELAKIIYGNIPTEKVILIERLFKEFVEKEKRDEMSKVHKPSTSRVLDPVKTLKKALDEAYSWNLLKAFDVAYSLSKTRGEYSHIGKLLAIKIGLITRRLPPGHNVIQESLIKELLKELQYSDDLVAEFIKKEANLVFENRIAEWISFVKEKREEIAKLIAGAEDEAIRDSLAFIFYSPSRYVVQGPIGDELIKVFERRSKLLYEYIRSLKEVAEIFTILYSPKGWVEVQKRLAEIKTRYIEMKKRLEDQLRKFILVRILQREKLLEISFSLLSRIQPYLISVLAAIESYGLPINDRHTMLQEAYDTVMSDVYYLVDAKPPLDITMYFNFYQFLLHMLYYLTYFSSGDERIRIWKDAHNISKKGLDFFSSLLARGRIGVYNYLSYSSPIAFVLAKSSINLGDVPDELISYLRRLAFLPDHIVEELDKIRENTYAFMINSIVIMASLIGLISLKSSREYVITELLNLLDQVADWTIKHGAFSREMVDNFGDLVKILIKNSDRADKCKEKIKRLMELIRILIKSPEESEFEMAIVAPKLGSIIEEYVDKFGHDEELINEAKKLLEQVIRIWDKRGYQGKAREAKLILQAIKA